LEDLPEAIGGKSVSLSSDGRQESNGDASRIWFEMPATIDEIEREAIEATLHFTKGDKSRAARLLGIGRKTLYRKLEQYGNNGELRTEN
jgi:DNA-binding NtrC family response regulator